MDAGLDTTRDFHREQPEPYILCCRRAGFKTTAGGHPYRATGYTVRRVTVTGRSRHYRHALAT